MTGREVAAVKRQRVAAFLGDLGGVRRTRVGLTRFLNPSCDEDDFMKHEEGAACRGLVFSSHRLILKISPTTMKKS